MSHSSPANATPEIAKTSEKRRSQKLKRKRAIYFPCAKTNSGAGFCRYTEQTQKMSLAPYFVHAALHAGLVTGHRSGAGAQHVGGHAAGIHRLARLLRTRCVRRVRLRRAARGQ